MFFFIRLAGIEYIIYEHYVNNEVILTARYTSRP